MASATQYSSLNDDSTTRLYSVLVPIAFVLIVLLGFIGNILVIYVILANTKLKTVTNILLLNLSFADLSFLLVCGTFSVVHYALAQWPLGDPLCRLIRYLLYVTCYVTIYTLTAISFVRYWSVVHVARSRLFRSRVNVVVLIVLIWIVFLLAKIPVLVVHGVTTEGDTRENRTECTISNRQEAQRFFATFFVFAYALPLVVICTLYVLVVRHLKRQLAGKEHALRHNASVIRRQRHVTKIVILVVAVFAVCWLPLHVHLLLENYVDMPQSDMNKIMLVVWHCLAYSNALLNPIIYNFFSKDFRDSFKAALCCCGHNQQRTGEAFLLSNILQLTEK